MTVQRFAKYSKRVTPISYVDIVSDPYIQQCIQDVKDTLRDLQEEQDRHNPGNGGGVGLAASQLEFPYRPISPEDERPAPGFYPKNFITPNLYVVHIRNERALHERCEPCPVTVYINSVIIPLDAPDESPILLGEASFSIKGFRGMNVPRYNHITVFAQDMSGLWNEHHMSGFPARIHQHEADYDLYLSQLSFSIEEMRQIQDWIANPNLVPLTPVVPEKLVCTSKFADVGALSNWVNAHTTSLTEIPHHDASLVNKKVIIIGASRGIGLAFVRYYLERGYPVIATHRATQELTALQVYKYKYPDLLTLVTLDVTYDNGVERFAQSIRINSGDLIIYNAAVKGYEQSDTSLEEADINAVRCMFNVNYFSQFHLIKTLFEKLLQNDVLWVNVSSLVGITNHPNSGYSDCSAATYGLMQSSYMDLAERWEKLKGDPARVPCAISVCPGWKATTTGSFKYHADSDHIIRQLVDNCIAVVANNKIPGVYLYTGELKEEYPQAEWIKNKLIKQKIAESRSSAHMLNSVFKGLHPAPDPEAGKGRPAITHRKSL